MVSLLLLLLSRCGWYQLHLYWRVPYFLSNDADWNWRNKWKYVCMWQHRTCRATPYYTLSLYCVYESTSRERLKCFNYQHSLFANIILYWTSCSKGNKRTHGDILHAASPPVCILKPYMKHCIYNYWNDNHKTITRSVLSALWNTSYLVNCM